LRELCVLASEQKTIRAATTVFCLQVAFANRRLRGSLSLVYATSRNTTPTAIAWACNQWMDSERVEMGRERDLPGRLLRRRDRGRAFRGSGDRRTKGRAGGRELGADRTRGVQRIGTARMEIVPGRACWEEEEGDGGTTTCMSTARGTSGSSPPEGHVAPVDENCVCRAEQGRATIRVLAQPDVCGAGLAPPRRGSGHWPEEWHRGGQDEGAQGMVGATVARHNNKVPSVHMERVYGRGDDLLLFWGYDEHCDTDVGRWEQNCGAVATSWQTRGARERQRT
jgi:hypothetical protein